MFKKKYTSYKFAFNLSIDQLTFIEGNNSNFQEGNVQISWKRGKKRKGETEFIAIQGPNAIKGNKLNLNTTFKFNGTLYKKNTTKNSKKNDSEEWKKKEILFFFNHSKIGNQLGKINLDLSIFVDEKMEMTTTKEVEFNLESKLSKFVKKIVLKIVMNTKCLKEGETDDDFDNVSTFEGSLKDEEEEEEDELSENEVPIEFAPPPSIFSKNQDFSKNFNPVVSPTDPIGGVVTSTAPIIVTNNSVPVDNVKSSVDNSSVMTSSVTSVKSSGDKVVDNNNKKNVTSSGTDKEKEILQQNINSLQNTLQNYQVMLMQFEEKNNYLQMEREQLKLNLENTEKANVELSQKIFELNLKIKNQEILFENQLKEKLTNLEKENVTKIENLKIEKEKEIFNLEKKLKNLNLELNLEFENKINLLKKEKESDVNILQSELQKLNLDFENLKKEKNVTLENLSTCQVEKDTQIETLQKKIHELSQEVTTLQNKNLNLENDLKLKLNNLQNLETEFENSKNKINTLQNQLQNLQIENKNLQNNFEKEKELLKIEINEKSLNLENSSNSTSKLVETLKIERNNLQTENENLQKSLQNLENCQQENVTQIKTLQEKYQLLEKEKDLQKNEFEKKILDISNLSKKNIDLKSQELSEEILNLENKLKTLQKENFKLKDDNTLQKTNLEKINLNLQKEISEKEKLSQNLINKEKEILNINLELSQLQKTLQNLQNQIDKLNLEITEKEKLNVTKLNENLELKTNLEILKKDFENQINLIKKENENTLQNLSQKLSQEKQEKENELVNLQNLLQQKVDKITQLENELQNSLQNLNLNSTENLEILSEKENEINTLQNQLETLQQQLQKVEKKCEKKVTTLKEKNSNLEIELKNLQKLNLENEKSLEKEMTTLQDENLKLKLKLKNVTNLEIEKFLVENILQIYQLKFTNLENYFYILFKIVKNNLFLENVYNGLEFAINRNFNNLENLFYFTKVLQNLYFKLNFEKLNFEIILQNKILLGKSRDNLEIDNIFNFCHNNNVTDYFSKENVTKLLQNSVTLIFTKILQKITKYIYLAIFNTKLNISKSVDGGNEMRTLITKLNQIYKLVTSYCKDWSLPIFGNLHILFDAIIFNYFVTETISTKMAMTMKMSLPFLERWFQEKQIIVSQKLSQTDNSTCQFTISRECADVCILQQKNILSNLENRNLICPNLTNQQISYLFSNFYFEEGDNQENDVKLLLNMANELGETPQLEKVIICPKLEIIFDKIELLQNEKTLEKTIQLISESKFKNELNCLLLD